MPSRVLFHVNTGEAALQQAALRNIANLYKEMPTTSIELVIQGAALSLVMQNTPLQPELLALQDKHLDIAVCENTMNAREVTLEQLISGVRTVPSAVGELVRRQEEGFAYIKP